MNDRNEKDSGHAENTETLYLYRGLAFAATFIPSILVAGCAAVFAAQLPHSFFVAVILGAGTFIGLFSFLMITLRRIMAYLIDLLSTPATRTRGVAGVVALLSFTVLVAVLVDGLMAGRYRDFFSSMADRSIQPEYEVALMRQGSPGDRCDDGYSKVAEFAACENKAAVHTVPAIGSSVLVGKMEDGASTAILNGVTVGVATCDSARPVVFLLCGKKSVGARQAANAAPSQSSAAR